MTTGKAKAIALGATCYCGLVSLLATCGKAPRMPAMDGAVIVFKVSGILTVGEGQPNEQHFKTSGKRAPSNYSLAV